MTAITTPNLDSWFAAELAKVYAREPTNAGGLLLGGVVWGPKYIALLEQFCLASLLAPANARALLAANARIVMFTEPDGLAPVWRATAALDRAGIRYQIVPMPREVLVGEHELHKFLVLGAVHNLLLQWAKRAGESFHPLLPDHLFSERYVEAMTARGRRGKVEAIAHGAVSIDVDSAFQEIGTYRNGAALAIPARTLGDIGRRHLHQQMTASLRRPGAPFAMTQTLIWEGREALHFAGPIFNPAWLSPRLCREAPVLYPTTFDCELPYLAPGGFDLPGLDHDMVLVEISDRSKPAAGPAESLQHWTDFAWLQMNYDRRYLPIYGQRTMIPIEPNPSGLDELAIEADHTRLMAVVAAGRVAAMDAYFAESNRNNRPFMR